MKQIQSAHPRSAQVNKILNQLSKEFEVTPPKWRIVGGTTSLYFWDTDQILFSKVVLDEASDKLLELVVAHEFEHYLQDVKWHWPRGFRRFKEIDAEGFAITRVEKRETKYPVLLSRATPFADWLRVMTLSDVTAIAGAPQSARICRGETSQREWASKQGETTK